MSWTCWFLNRSLSWMILLALGFKGSLLLHADVVDLLGLTVVVSSHLLRQCLTWNLLTWSLPQTKWTFMISWLWMLLSVDLLWLFLLSQFAWWELSNRGRQWLSQDIESRLLVKSFKLLLQDTIGSPWWLILMLVGLLHLTRVTLLSFILRLVQLLMASLRVAPSEARKFVSSQWLMRMATRSLWEFRPNLFLP